MFGRTSQIRTGDLYHVKAHRTRHNTLGLGQNNTRKPYSCLFESFSAESAKNG